MNAVCGQAAYDLRFDWGPSGAAAVAPGAAVVVVVDVLSFTTTLALAVERDIAVMPFPGRDAKELAAEHDATLAVGRSEAGPGKISLSPRSLLDPPAGVRRPDGGLRPAVEDLWGAGAVIDALAGGRSISPEAAAARTAYASVAGSVSDSLSSTGSGVELAAIGFGSDVAMAAEESVSRAVPVLRGGWFVDGGSGRAEPLV
ncbi:2-phosphosulfolactate phosphatase [Actinoplanes sp. NPDC051411]|uniref:2-phosphosulfolactate phosphatase n=1 Tax=Actinoplanes sp. NPDC051411 TaxID=3155522 RepID=UPI003447CDB4